MSDKIEAPKINTNGKMKLTGYILLAVSLALTLLLFFGAAEESATKVSLIQFWAGAGIAMLFGNAGKHILGGYAKTKASNGL